MNTRICWKIISRPVQKSCYKMVFCMCERRKLVKICRVVLFIVTICLLPLLVRHLTWPSQAFFLPVMTADEKSEMIRVTSLFATVLERRNITYFMFGGTLLGSFRHHDVIPWDDDMDFMVNGSQKMELLEEIEKLRPYFGLHRPSNDIADPRMWKVYSTNGTKVTIGSFKWPFVDLFFFDENATHIWNPEARYMDEVYVKSNIFPLVRRPLGNLELYSPCDPVYMLNHDYNISVCVSRDYDHRTGMRLFQFASKRLPCQELVTFFSFVKRNISDNVVTETLQLGPLLRNIRQFSKHQCANPLEN